MPALFASSRLHSLEPREPSTCPYHPQADAGHRIRWGFYERYAERGNRRSERIRVQRCRCTIALGTFSLLSDSLLPYHAWRVADILRWLFILIVQGRAVATLAREESRPRKTLSDLKARFLRVVNILRLSGHPGALAPPEFLKGLARMTGQVLITLFQNWKELEPKHSILGIYAR